MNVEECIEAGQLEAAFDALQKTVRDQPDDDGQQALLFELLSVMGNWNQALTQLDKIDNTNSDGVFMAQTYRELLMCEALREEVFTGRREPLYFDEPEDWLALLMKSMEPVDRDHRSRVHKRVMAAIEQSVPRSGTIDDQPFSWINDADMRLGPVFEIILNGKYYWVLADHIAEISFAEPVYLRDLVWLPTAVRWVKDGSYCIGFMPTRYPGLATVSDPQSALARKTAWTDIGEHFFIGSGQRMFTTENDEYPLLQTRKIVFSTEFEADVETALVPMTSS